MNLLKKVLRSYVREKKTRVSTPKRHTRYVPTRLARDVKQRDEFRCTYVGPNGVRCNQKAHLEIDHVRPWAKGGSSHDIDNLRCLCRMHNLFVAKKDFPTFWAGNTGELSNRDNV
ncbi:MAG: HNH endonuclease [Deltaproteobacteria bacterium]|nr:HNH endonuclease [Deltaproteobacteria bacterium]